MNSNKGILVVISGPSGVGKGTVIKALLEEDKNISLSVSATTRSPRVGEEHGVSYYFVSRDEFEKMIETDALLEYAQYNTNMYGTPKEAVKNKLSSGSDVLLEIEVVGAGNVKKKFNEAVMIFIAPPTLETLSHRLRGRGTETEEVIASRLHAAETELMLMRNYDYIVVNDTVEGTVQKLRAIIAAEKLKTERNTDYIENIETAVGKENK